MKPRRLIWLGCIALVAGSLLPISLILPGVIGVGPLNQYGGGIYLADFHVSWILFAVATLPLYYLCSRGQDGVLLAASGYFLAACFGAAESAMLVVGVLLLQVLLKARDCLARHIAFAAWITLFCLWLPGRVVFEGIPGRAPGPYAPILWVPVVQVQIWLFETFFKRSMWCYRDVSQMPSLRWTLGDLLRYMVGLPNLVGLSAAPSFAHFLTSRRDGEAESTPWRGAITTAICVGWMTVAIVVPMFYLREVLWRPEDYSPQLLWMAILLLGGMRFVGRLCNEQLSVGIWRLFGYNIRDDFRHPLWSPNVVEFWRRWNMLWREYLLQSFFYPVLLALGRRYGPKSAWIYFVAASATFLGACFFDMFPRVALFWIVVPEDGKHALSAFLVYHCICGVLVGAGLFLEARARWRMPPAEKTTAPRWIRWLDYGACVGLTYVVMSVLLMAHHFVGELSWAEIARAFTYRM